MYKRIIILILILAVVCSLAAIEHIAISRTFENFEFRLQQIDLDFQSNTVNINDITNLISYWNQRKRILYMVVPHIEIRNIESYLYQLKNAVEFEEYFEGSEYIEVLISQSQSIPRTFIFCLENIL